MEIIKKTSRKIGNIREYHGVCDHCGVEQDFYDDLIAIEIFQDDARMVLVPIDELVCPSCQKHIERMIMYKSLDITEELKSLETENGSNNPREP